MSLREEQGHLMAKSGYQRGHSQKIRDLDSFKKYVDQHADSTLPELAIYFKLSASTVGRALRKIGYRRKKRVQLIAKGRKHSAKNIWTNGQS